MKSKYDLLKETKRKLVAFRMTEEMNLILKEIAYEQNRTVSNIIETSVIEFLKRNNKIR